MPLKTTDQSQHKEEEEEEEEEEGAIQILFSKITNLDMIFQKIKTNGRRERKASPALIERTYSANGPLGAYYKSYRRLNDSLKAVQTTFNDRRDINSL
jgi:hypothetical protein